METVHTGLDSGLEQDTGVASLVVNGDILVKLVKLEADLVTIDTAPSEELTVLGASQRVVLATVDVGNVVVLKGGELDRSEDDGIVLACVGLDTNLAKVVQTPAVDTALVVDGEAVVGATGNLDNLASGQTDALGSERRHLVALDDASSELVLLTATPGNNVTLDVESKDVVGTGCEGGDLLECGDEDGSRLNLDGL